MSSSPGAATPANGLSRQDSSSSAAVTTTGKPRIRAFAACIECNKAKVKCDGHKPNGVACTRCVSHGLQCGWAKSRRGRLPGSKNKPKGADDAKQTPPQQQQQRQLQPQPAHQPLPPPYRSQQPHFPYANTLPAQPGPHSGIESAQFQSQTQPIPYSNHQQQEHIAKRRRLGNADSSPSAFNQDPPHSASSSSSFAMPQSPHAFQAPISSSATGHRPASGLQQSHTTPDMASWWNAGQSNAPAPAKRSSRSSTSIHPHQAFPDQTQHQQAQHPSFRQQMPAYSQPQSSTLPPPPQPGPDQRNVPGSGHQDFAPFSSFGHDIGATFNPAAFHLDLNNLPQIHQPSFSQQPPAPMSSSASVASIDPTLPPSFVPNFSTTGHLAGQQYSAPAQQPFMASSGQTSSGRATPQMSTFPNSFSNGPGASNGMAPTSSQFGPAHSMPSHPASFTASAGSATAASASASAPSSLPPTSMIPPPSPSLLGPPPNRNTVILPPLPLQTSQLSTTGAAAGATVSGSPAPPGSANTPPTSSKSGGSQRSDSRSGGGGGGGRMSASITPAPDRLSGRLYGALASNTGRPLELYSLSDPANPLNLLSHAALTSKADGVGGARAAGKEGGSAGGRVSAGVRSPPHSADAVLAPIRDPVLRSGGHRGAGLGSGGPPQSQSSGSGYDASSSLHPHAGGGPSGRHQQVQSGPSDMLNEEDGRVRSSSGGRRTSAVHQRAVDGDYAESAREVRANDARDGQAASTALVAARRTSEEEGEGKTRGGTRHAAHHKHGQAGAQAGVVEHEMDGVDALQQGGGGDAALSEHERYERQQARRKRTQALTLGMLDANAFDREEERSGSGAAGARRKDVQDGGERHHGGRSHHGRSSGRRRASGQEDLVPAELTLSRPRSAASSRSSSFAVEAARVTVGDGDNRMEVDGDDSDGSGVGSDVDDADQEESDAEEDADGDEEGDFDASAAFVIPAPTEARPGSATSAVTGLGISGTPGTASGTTPRKATSRSRGKGARGRGAEESVQSGTPKPAADNEKGSNGAAAAATGAAVSTSTHAKNKTKARNRGPAAVPAEPASRKTVDEEARYMAAYRSRLSQYGWKETRLRSAVEERENYFRVETGLPPVDVKEVPDVITLGILTEVETEKLFAFYFRELNVVCAFLDPHLHTSAYVRARSNFLFTVICFIAASVDPNPSLQSRVTQLDTLCSELATLCCQRMARSCEIVQAMLLYNLWSLENGSSEQDMGSMYVMNAVRMSLEIGLDVTVKDPTGAEQHTREGRNRLRAFITAVIQDRSLSAFTGRAPTANLDVYGKLDNWVDSPLAIPADVEDVGFVRLRLLEQDIRSSLAATEPDDHVGLERVRKMANDKMKAWFAKWTTKTILDEAPVTRATMKVVALHVQLLLNTSTKSACRNRKADCLHIASELLVIVNTELQNSVQYICRTIQGMIAWAAVVVIQLTDGDVPSLAVDTALLMAGNANDSLRERTFARFYGRFLLATIESVHTEYLHPALAMSDRKSKAQKAANANAEHRMREEKEDEAASGNTEQSKTATSGSQAPFGKGPSDATFDSFSDPNVKTSQDRPWSNGNSIMMNDGNAAPLAAGPSATNMSLAASAMNAERSMAPPTNVLNSGLGDGGTTTQTFPDNLAALANMPPAPSPSAAASFNFFVEASGGTGDPSEQQQVSHTQGSSLTQHQVGTNGLSMQMQHTPDTGTMPNHAGATDFTMMNLHDLDGMDLSALDENFLLPPGIEWEAFLAGSVPLSQRRI